ncbi:MAG: hypothetical protein OHK93_003032 [Ramalina farinacea]|uniref:Uncharacterized protein n=1 Tax=Ramalina farinacea TaxID=258253 RepID=A0AA43TUB7_9LECA|nr:hypothetical protein [Ramalina farinacea]
MYLSYPPTYTVSGQIPTTIDGKSTCATFTDYEGTALTWPSHPTIAPTAPILNADRFEQDPQGWSWVFKTRDTFAFDIYSNASLPEEDRHPGEWWVRPFFPDLPLWNCSAGVYYNNPYAVAAKTALFLTGSSTAFEDGDDDGHDEVKTSSLGLPASAVTPTPTAPASVAAAPILVPSSTDQAPSAKTAPSATPANTASDQLPLQTWQPSQTAGDSPASNAKGTAASLPEGGSIRKQGSPTENAMDNSLPVPSADIKAQPTHTTSAKAEITATSPNARVLPANSRSQVVSSDTPKASSPSPINADGTVATPLVLLPGGQSVALWLSDSKTTLAVQTSGPSRSFQFASQAIAIDSQGQYRVGGLTLSPNQAVTVTEASTDVGKGGGGSSLPQHTDTAGSGQSGLASTTALSALVVGSQTIQPNAKGDFIFQSQTFTTDTAGRLIVGGATLAPGTAVTVSGTPISLSPQRTVAISGKSAQTGLGPAIMGGLGPGAQSSFSNASVSGTGSGGPVAPVAFTGGASRIGKEMLCELVIMGLALLGLVYMV